MSDGPIAFVGGTHMLRDKMTPYCRRMLDSDVEFQLDEWMQLSVPVVIGDADGVDATVQYYLANSGYENVTVYYSGDKPRNLINPEWKTVYVDASTYNLGTVDWHAQKDILMCQVATEGLFIICDEGSKATRRNLHRLLAESKPVQIFELSKYGVDYDRWIDPGDVPEEVNL